MSPLREQSYTILLILSITSSFLNVEGRINVLTTLDDETVYSVREKPIVTNIDIPSKGLLVSSRPIHACTPISPNPLSVPGYLNRKTNATNSAVNASLSTPPSTNDDLVWILLVSWGANDDCSIRTKVDHAIAAGYTTVLFQDPANFYNDYEADTDGTESLTPLLSPITSSYSMYASKLSDEGVYACTVNPTDWDVLHKNFTTDEYYLSFEDSGSMGGWFTYFVVGILVIGAVFFTIGLSYVLVQLLVLILIWIRESIVSRIQQVRRDRRRRLPASQLKKIPIQQWNADMLQDMCSICLESYSETDRVRILPCSHVFHQACIDPWLLKQRRKCPNCKRKIAFPDENRESDSSSDDERTPLLRRSSSARESSSASASTSPRNSRLQQNHHERVQQRSGPQLPPQHSLSAGNSPQRISNAEIHRILSMGMGTGTFSHPDSREAPSIHQQASTSSTETGSTVQDGIECSNPNPHQLKEKVDQLCARMENVGRKIKKKAKQNQKPDQTDSSSDMSTSTTIQPVLVSVTVESNKTNNCSDDDDNNRHHHCDQSHSHDDDEHNKGEDDEYDNESHKKCKTQQPSTSSHNANGNGDLNSSQLSNPDLGLEVKVVPDCQSTSPSHITLNLANKSENHSPGRVEESSIVPDLNA